MFLFVFNSEELDKFMESQGASVPGILTLTSSLSKPFMRLEKYPTLLQELERHVEVLEENEQKKKNTSEYKIFRLKLQSLHSSSCV